MKLYNNVPLIPKVDETDDRNIVTVGHVHGKLWEEKTRVVVDTPEHYELATLQDGTEGLLIVDDGTLTDIDSQVELSNVQGKILDTDTHSYVSGEYVNLVAEVNHEETYEEEIYAKKSEIPEGNTLMTTDEFNDLWGEVIILDYQES